VLRGKLKGDPGYVETWGTLRGVLEVWEDAGGLLVEGECTDIVELYTWLLPSIRRTHSTKDLTIGHILIPSLDEERARLRIRVRRYLERHSPAMERVPPSRTATT